VVKTEKTTITEPEATRAVTAVKAKAAVPCMIVLSPPTAADQILGNISPYSSGMPGASLTSTSVDPSQTTSSKLLWDEVCIVSS
jgi:peptidyl-prolyl cis-trans isomerase-like protein 2